MKKKIIVINLLLSLVLAPGSIFAKSFTDVKNSGKTEWAYKYVEELSNKNILNGYEDGTFRPNNPVSFLETMQIIKTLINPSEDDMRLARETYMETANANGVIDWAKDAICFNLYHGTITEKTLINARERGFLDNKLYPNRNSIAVYFARALNINKSKDTSNLKYKDKKKINPLTIEYLPNLVNSKIFTSTGSEGYFNGNLAIRRSEMAVITSKSLEHFNSNLDKVRKHKEVNAEDLLVNTEENNKDIKNNSLDKDNNIDKNTILDNNDLNTKPHDGVGELEAAEANIPINFKGQVIEIIDSKNVSFIRIKVIESDSDRFGTGQIITVNTFRKHNINDIVEGSGILGENSLTNIKLK
ncbi:S-layer homology domain-containing protein [Peptoniphilus vaginalis]|uniref:S-layer homology domain-containing protein n=1 Tax=Peptoniphilus vaginalis TaxID=1756987 RepID=UPI000A272827|nr:S-layer homology domain-containing protein [Peptoniphilus vaginalis]